MRKKKTKSWYSNMENLQIQNKNNNVILVGEDEAEVRSYLEMALKCMGYAVELAQDGDEVISCLESETPRFSAVILDLMMPQRDGFETLKAIRNIDPRLPVIMLSGASSVSNVVEAMKCGATDFLPKPFEHEDLKKTITSAMEPKFLPQPMAVPETRSIPAKTGITGGSSPAMKAILSQVTDIGWSDAPVLIQGETGSGKEVMARELHAKSPRAGKVFLKLNCAALPSELLESELFGYERGAFTGALQRKVGMFEVADGGTLLLDEIGDMDIRLQAKLLHVLQDHEFHRIGGKDVIRVDVRIMASTHRDLQKAIREQTFREDLYYRLNVINLEVPPLRERREDIVSLAEAMMRRHARPGAPLPLITPNLRQALASYNWPGNVRELENVMRNLLVFRNPDALALRLENKAKLRSVEPAEPHLPATPMRHIHAAPKPALEEVSEANKRAEADAILSALQSTHWNRKQAASLLQVDYKVFLYKMKKLGIPGKIQSSTTLSAGKMPALSSAAVAH
jgi:two-component system, NtrC family, response regulator AtoC